MTSSDQSTTPPSAVASLYRQGGDLWQRARTNSLAHKLAAERMEALNSVLVIVEGFAITIPIVAASLSLEYVTSLVHGDPGRTPVPTLPFGLTHSALSIISILASGVALFAIVAIEKLRFAEKAAEHRTLQASYAVVAQKARRLEASDLDAGEGRFLLRHLQELFETYKSNPLEPSDKMFRKAQSILPLLKPIPFGLDVGRTPKSRWGSLRDFVRRGKSETP